MIVRVRGVKRVRAKGRIYFYHLATRTRVAAAYGTPAFIDEIRRLDGRVVDDDRPLGALIRA